LPANWDVLWSLSIEELFYVMFPLLCWLLPRPLLMLALGALVVSLPWTRGLLDGNEIWQEKAYLPAMSAIALGVLTAHVWHAVTPSRGFARCLSALGLLGLLASLFYAGELWRALHHGSLLFIAGSAAALLLGVEWARLGAPRGLNWLAGMGRVSYELYLTHMFVVLAVVAAHRQLFADNLTWGFLAYPPAIIGCTLLAAWLERRYCKPCERALRARLGDR
jgi:peptidoglycan/LPS O-acetylase OafA/YrhL